MRKLLAVLFSGLAVTSFANCPLVQAGSGGTDYNTGRAQVTFSCPMPDGDYTVVISNYGSGPAYALATTDQTATGFMVTSVPYHTLGFNWVAVHK